MNNTQIECFLCTAILESYTKAAEYLYLSQPTVSRYIATLEKELGCKLLRRTTKKVEMTEAGMRYYRLFSHWKAEAAEVKEEVLAMSGSAERKLRVGFLEGWPMQPDVLAVCRQFEKEYPYIKVEFVALGLSEIMNAILSENLDLGIVIENLELDRSSYNKRKICDIKKSIWYSANHPLAKKPEEEITLDDFKEEAFLVLSEDLDYVLKRNIELYSQFHDGLGIRTVDNMQTLYMKLAEGMGVSIQDEWGPATVNPLYKQFRLEEEMPIYMVWKSPHSKEDTVLFENYFCAHFD